MILPNKKTPIWIILSLDFFLLILSIILSFSIRFEFNFEQIKLELLDKYLESVCVFLIIKISLFTLNKVYQGIVRHTSIQDVKKIFYSIFIFFS